MTEEKDIQRVSEIITERGALGTRYVVTVDFKSKKFRSAKKALAYRNKQLALQQEQQERREAQRKAAEIAAEEARLRAEEDRLRAEYEKDPEYFSITVKPPLLPAPEGTDVQAYARVDVEAYAREIDTACFRLARFGYEVISITPLLSGYSAYLREYNKDQSSGYGWGAGWGFSYTDGIVILGRKKQQSAHHPAITDRSAESPESR